jgi:hypothetical protein
MEKQIFEELKKCCIKLHQDNLDLAERNAILLRQKASDQDDYRGKSQQCNLRERILLDECNFTRCYACNRFINRDTNLKCCKCSKVFCDSPGCFSECNNCGNNYCYGCTWASNRHEQPCLMCKTKNDKEIFQVIAENNNYRVCTFKYKGIDYECGNLIYDNASKYCGYCLGCHSTSQDQEQNRLLCQYIYLVGHKKGQSCQNPVAGWTVSGGERYCVGCVQRDEVKQLIG